MTFRRRRLSLFALSLLVGIGMSSWVTRTPAVRDAVEASTAQMGLILFGLSVGSMVGVLSAGAMVRRWGARPVIVAGAVLVLAGTAVVGPSAAWSTAGGVFAGLLLFGLGGGLGEIGLNIEAAALERVSGRPVLPALHGSFSLGTVLGALAGIALTAAAVPPAWHLLGAAAIMLGLALWAFPGIPAGTGRTSPRSPGVAAVSDDVPTGGASGRPPSVWRDPRLVLIGAVVLAMAFAEGAANDWLPLLMVDGHDVDPSTGALVYAGFAAAMTIGRFAGGPVVVRFGRAPVLRTSAVLAILGILLVVVAPNVLVACLAVLLWGLGASLGFPVAISAAGDDPDRASERVSAVATSGYLAFLVGPPLLGFVGEHAGLRLAMLVVVAFLVAAAFAAGAARDRRDDDPAAGIEGSGRGTVHSVPTD
ncbi:MFS transporter [Paraoerskovia sediminicola]|uniref:MFS transporter n=1 Tax=Paraoerskovia sediminicola TaxID=1138587 RepID=A0ABN6XBM6_9CELL|nr:MFS transporter [Paraoerskovia sediminicola]BDZ42125.1 MFS transporter [Paraoerskovia sediminicola]